MSEFPNPEVHDARQLFPTPEDWVELQGGMPRVFRQPDRPAARWIVLHVYDEHEDYGGRFTTGNGLIVDTLPDRVSNTALVPAGGRHVEVPTCMLRALHGEVCDNRSAILGGEGYDRVVNQPQYEALLEQYRSEGMQELRWGLATHAESGRLYLTFKPLPAIREARPLSEQKIA